MTPTFKPFLIAGALFAGMASAQSDPTPLPPAAAATATPTPPAQVQPPVVAPPVVAAPVVTPPVVVPPVVEAPVVIAPVVTPPVVAVPVVPAPINIPPAPGNAAPAPSPAADPAVVAALRAQFEALKLREAQNTAMRQTASQDTLSQIATVEQTITANESQQQLIAWKAESLTALSAELAAEPTLGLPDGLPDGVTPDIALAYVQAQTTLYAQPKVSAELTIRTIDTATTVLRIAETGAFTLIWSPTDKFAFVLSQSRTVY
ncbi:hypothetical protein [Rhodovulum sp. FJ3]|uniref:hypothetical protein n=1 Tax=Rhodovulum sp. FJ3 TaxID=3079053 RepID=UPI00293DF51C|nr:hypothetical protein [Rhodovulum sp. FJ3]MDV4169259.1 hypothetical protein [Rhodovulum sp. FJ3]